MFVGIYQNTGDFSDYVVQNNETMGIRYNSETFWFISTGGRKSRCPIVTAMASRTALGKVESQVAKVQGRE